MYDEIQSIVVDLGSENVKIGCGGDRKPKAEFPSLVGKIAPVKDERGFYRKYKFAGNEVLSLDKSKLISLDRVIVKQQIANFADIETLLYHCFYNVMRYAPEEHPVLLTEPPNPSSSNREKLTQIMFETFSVPAMYTSPVPLLSLYATGRDSGTVVDAGWNVTNIVPIINGKIVRAALSQLDFGGNDVTNQLKSLLLTQDLNLNYQLSTDIIKKIKEQLSYVSYNGEKELGIARFSHDLRKTYILPDGNEIELGTERFLCTEKLFSPSSLTQHIANSIQYLKSYQNNCSWDLILSGGTSLHSGYTERISSELRTLPLCRLPNVISKDYRKYMAWLGGSLITQQESFQNKWIAKEEYDEHGPSAIHWKCPIYCDLKQIIPCI